MHFKNDRFTREDLCLFLNETMAKIIQNFEARNGRLKSFDLKNLHISKRPSSICAQKVFCSLQDFKYSLCKQQKFLFYFLHLITLSC